MRDIARPDHQKSLRTQRRQRLPQLIRTLHAQAALQGQRYHRYIGIGVHLSQGYPGAVVQTLRRRFVHRETSTVQHLNYLTRCLRAARRRVMNLI
jgi:hypothetical protein